MRKRPPPSGELRRRAEDELDRRGDPRATETSRLVHELEVHQIELELQNEELVAARHDAETALARFTEVFDFAPIGYAALDSAGEIRELNFAGATLLGAERGRLLGKRFAAFVPQRTRARFAALLRSTIEHGPPVGDELELAAGDAALPVRMTAVRLPRGDGAVLLGFEDVSERRAREAELASTERALREANHRKDEFLAMLSHELRNPLSPVLTSVAVLRAAPPGSEEAARALDILERSASHLARLVDDLLDVTRITRGKIELQREPVDLAALVVRAVDDRRASFAQRGVALEVRTGPDALWVHGDPARLLQVLSNVLGNAEKFTPRGGAVTVTADLARDRAAVRVMDTGAGIAPEVIGSVFEPFVQGPQALDRAQGGLGLGLAMVRSIVEMHGGSVALRSAGLGHGTEVTIVLPLERARLPAIRPESPRAAASRAVLVIEDQRDAADSLGQALTLAGHVVRVAYDGRSGIEVARAFLPDVVLCDLGLPDLDGYAVARAFRAEAELRGTYLVALSGYARPEDHTRARASGFDRHLAKPASIEQLERVLAKAPVRAPPVPPRNELL